MINIIKKINILNFAKDNFKKNDIELYRSLRTRIQSSKQEAKIISIVSNDIDDGKSNIAFSLAESYAKTGRKVLLIDANLRDSQLSINANLDFDKGLDKLLKGNFNVQQAIIKMNSENLFLLPTQKSVNDSTELLDSDLLPAIFEEVKIIFDFIIVDTLAINSGMDALIISKLCHGAIFVTVENKTKCNELIDNKSIFDEAGVDILGAVHKITV